MCLPLRRFPIMMNYGICIRCSDRVTVTTAMHDTEKEITAVDSTSTGQSKTENDSSVINPLTTTNTTPTTTTPNPALMPHPNIHNNDNNDVAGVHAAYALWKFVSNGGL